MCLYFAFLLVHDFLLSTIFCTSGIYAMYPVNFHKKMPRMGSVVDGRLEHVHRAETMKLMMAGEGEILEFQVTRSMLFSIS